SVVIHLRRVRPQKLLYPFLKQSFLLEFAQVRRRLRSVRGSLSVFTDAGIFSAEHHPAIGSVWILDFSAHFHLHFMNQVLGVPNFIFNIPRGAKQRAKLARPPPNERRLILSFKLLPATSRLLQPRHHVGAFGCCSGSQWSLLDPNDLQPIPGQDRHGPSATSAFS